MDVDPLREFATALAKELSGALGNQADLQQARYRELPVRWRDSPAADRAAGFVGTLSQQVGAQHETLSGVAQAASAAADALERVVRAKADAVRTDLSATTVAGKTADQVDQIVAHARGGFAGTGDIAARAQLVQQVLPEMSSTTDPVSYCQRWLNQVFTPAVEGRVAAFAALSDATHTAVQGVYDHLSSALESANSVPYTSPDGGKSATTALGNSVPTASPIAATTASYVTPASSPVSTTPASTTKADSSAPVAQDNSTAPASTQQSASSTTTPAASFIAADTTGNSGGAGSGGAVANTPPTSAPGTSPDIGTPGVWRPGDIASVLSAANVSGIVQGISSGIQGVGTVVQAFGTVAQDVGDLVKDVVGPDGVTGLIHEGVDAAGKIDLMVEHHVDPASVHDPGASTPAPAGAGGHTISGGGDSHTGGAPVPQPAGTPATDTSSAAAASPNNAAVPASGHAVSGSVVHSVANHPGDMRFNLATPPTTGSTGTASGFLGTPSMGQSAGGESEHRSKIQYRPLTNTNAEPEQPKTAGGSPDTGAELPSVKGEPPL